MLTQLFCFNNREEILKIQSGVMVINPDSEDRLSWMFIFFSVQ